MKLKFVALCLLGMAATQATACYVVYDSFNRVVYNAQTPPVDMSLPLHQTMPKIYPGGHLIFSVNTECQRERITALTVMRAQGASPLLTDPRTAASMKAPHVILASGAALIEQRPDNMSPGVVVVSPMRTTATARPVPVTTNRMRTGTVITEMRDPPMTVVQNGDNMALSELR